MILDVHMPGCAGLEVIEALRRREQATRMPLSASPCKQPVCAIQLRLLQQRSCDTQQIASASVRAYCVRIGKHEWPIARVVQRNESPFLPLARVGPTTPKQSGAKHQTCPHLAIRGPPEASLAVRVALMTETQPPRSSCLRRGPRASIPARPAAPIAQARDPIPPRQPLSSLKKPSGPLLTAKTCL
jgi:hypothetical protein